MNFLNKINSKYFLCIDIETVKLVKSYYDLSEDYKTAWKYKMKNEGVVPDEAVMAEKYNEKAAMYAEFAKVCAISISYLNKNGTKLNCKEFYGENELELLLDFATFTNKIKAHDSNYRLVAHAGKYFDYPFLCKRSIINGMRLPSILDDGHLKPWDRLNLCSNQDIWKMGGSGPGSSLIALCVALGLPISKDDLVGDEVGEAYFRGEFERIGRYCSQDAVAVFNILRKIKQEPIVQYNEVNYI
jgi:3'-5' exonuclease